MQDGATLKTMWVTRRKKRDVLTYPDGTRVIIQKSTISPLVGKGKLGIIAWIGGINEYKLNG